MLLDLFELKNKYSLEIQTLLHVGAHKAEELVLYQNLRIEQVIWIEANPELYKHLENKLKNIPGQKVINAVVADTNDVDVHFNITSNTQASSMYELGSHKKYYPNIIPEKEIILKTKRIDRICKDYNLSSQYDFINLDIQGAELKALKGMGELLNNIKYVYLEVNLIDIYKNCPKLHHIDFFLVKHGFSRVELKLTNAFWGDAFYIREPKRKLLFGFNMIIQALLLETNASIKQLRDRIYIMRKKYGWS